jgi:hypothetical protein
MYFGEPKKRLYNFSYNGKFYGAGTKFIFNGRCLLNGREVFLDNQICEYLYTECLLRHFKHNENICTCRWEDFDWRIRGVVEDKVEQPTVQQKTEIYWTDDMVVKTIWYVMIMLVATIFYERVGIWIFATIVWYISTFKKKN